MRWHKNELFLLMKEGRDNNGLPEYAPTASEAFRGVRRERVTMCIHIDRIDAGRGWILEVTSFFCQYGSLHALFREIEYLPIVACLDLNQFSRISGP